MFAAATTKVQFHKIYNGIVSSLIMKTVLLSTLAFVSIMGVNAQANFGIKGGYSSSGFHFSGESVGNVSRKKPGFNAGVFSMIHISNSFILQPEAFFSEEGAKAPDSSNTVQYNYLNVPFLIKYQHRSGAFIETGPQVGFYLYSNSSLGGMNTSLKSVSNSTTFSWVFGAGYKIPDFPLGIDFRYNQGISNIENYTIFTLHSNVFQVALFYIFK
jgi:hypothetical protein